MNAEGIREIARDVFQQLETKEIGGWISMRCPLAPYLHEKGADRNPSFGVHVNSNGTSIGNCFVCKNPAPFHVWLQRYAEYTGEDLDALIAEVEDEEYLGPMSLPDWETIRANPVQEVAMPLDDAVYMDLYPSAKDHAYVRDRGISARTASLLELRYESRDPADGEPRILFPIRGIDGLLYGFSGRALRDTAVLKVRDYFGLKKASSLLGAHLAHRYDRILIVEGLFDYARAHECGQGGCAVMHATMTNAQAAIVRDIGKPTYLFYDYDKAGREGAQIAGTKLARYVPVMRTRYPIVANYKLKDPAELLPEEFDSMIADAILF